MPDKTAGSDLHGHTHLNTNSKPTHTALKFLEIPHTVQVNNIKNINHNNYYYHYYYYKL